MKEVSWEGGRSVEGGESRGEAVTNGKTLREEEEGGEDRRSVREGSPPLFSVAVLSFGLGDFGKYKNAQ